MTSRRGRACRSRRPRPNAAGEHAITSRAIDPYGTIQPAMDDLVIATKKTFWESNGQITRRVRVEITAK